MQLVLLFLLLMVEVARRTVRRVRRRGSFNVDTGDARFSIRATLRFSMTSMMIVMLLLLRRLIAMYARRGRRFGGILGRRRAGINTFRRLM